MGQPFYKISTASKVSVSGVFLVRIFPHLDWIRRDSQYDTKYADHKNSEYEHFPRIEDFLKNFSLLIWIYYSDYNILGGNINDFREGCYAFGYKITLWNLLTYPLKANTSKLHILRFGNMHFYAVCVFCFTLGSSVLSLLRANGKYNVNLCHLTRRC